MCSLQAEIDPRLELRRAAHYVPVSAEIDPRLGLLICASRCTAGLQVLL
jgi:hypothetical protein